MDKETALKGILIDELFVDLSPAQIGLDDSLRDTLGLDSLGFSELRAQCEHMFNVTIADEHFNPTHFASIRSLVQLLDTLQANAASAQGTGR